MDEQLSQISGLGQGFDATISRLGGGHRQGTDLLVEPRIERHSSRQISVCFEETDPQAVSIGMFAEVGRLLDEAPSSEDPAYPFR